MTALDKEMALEVLREHVWADMPADDPVLPLLDECVLPAKAQTLDRDALEQELRSRSAKNVRDQVITDAADAIFALLQPAETIALTREEAELAAYALRNVKGWPTAGYMDPVDDAASHIRKRVQLADRLEAQL